MAAEVEHEVVHKDGRVYVNGRCIADRAGWFSYNIEKFLTPARERTSDDWWRRAYEIEMLSAADNTGGPLGDGVDFFAWDVAEAVPLDVREAIQHDAYEAARDVIVSSLDEHLAQLVRSIANV